MGSSQENPSGTPARLDLIYQALFARYGPQHWWPADEPFEVMVGAVLTQSAAWTNVEKAIANLKLAGVLSPHSLREIPSQELARLVYSSGYYNAKASKLKALVQYLGDRYQDSLPEMFSQATAWLREELLAVHGVGEETADSILLYAAEKPVFVVDAYTRREFSRIGLCSEKDSYRTVQALFMENLSPDSQLFNEYHALIVRHGKEICLKRPLCGRCCLLKFCGFGGQAVDAQSLS
ncbi:MAG: endonuclease III domain-containing protein [Dehalococcoidia bacterium]|nr:endonuclease III domain-containing protein [Dehalococcoidia bacterium]